MKYELIAEKPANRTLIEQVLINRGLKPEDINHYLSANEKDLIDPLKLDNMERGARMYIKHIAADDPMTMIVDPDVDGMTSAALFINYTYKLFPAYVQNRITYLCHSGKQHGLNDMMDEIPEDTKIMVLIDSSSNDYEYHKELADRGIDVLVVDHHEADKVSEYACVINNQLSQGYSNKNISGVGVIYKFCCYLDKKLGIYNAHDLEDLVSIGLIADMMDVRSFETRYLVSNGLKDIQNPLIKELANRQAHQFQNGITPTGAAFYIAPFINAVMRSGTMEEKFLLFESMLEHRAYEMIPSTKRGCKDQLETLVEQAARTSNNVKARQKRSVDAGLAVINKMISEQNLLKNKILIILLSDDSLDRNLAGLVANQLASEYQRPTIVVRDSVVDGKRVWGGSARGYEKSSLKDFRAFVKSTGLADGQGHANAFGITINYEDMSAFIDKTNEMLADIDFSPNYQVDAIIDYSRLTDSLVFEIANWAELWGQNLSEPLIAIEKVPANTETFALIGSNQKTMRISHETNKLNFIKFNLKDEEKDALQRNEAFNLNIVGKFILNNYMGVITPQVQIVDYEIISTRKWDF